MDSKSIARKGVPVRLRDPVLNPDETLGFVGVFLSLWGAFPSRGGGRNVEAGNDALGDNADFDD